MKKFIEKDVAENPLYHDTWKLLKKYRDVAVSYTHLMTSGTGSSSISRASFFAVS